MNPWHLALLLTGCFSLATVLMPWHQKWSGVRGENANVLNAMMGDSRRLFANHFFEQADVYFHSGFYPSIFDQSKAHKTVHMAADAGVVEDKNEGEDTEFLGKPRDWIDGFSRHFFPSRHTHLDAGGAEEGHEGHDHSAHEKEGDEEDATAQREILPWLRISAELDPTRVETYTVASFWLRKMNKPEQAMQFLRDGLRANPNSYEILLELGRLYEENRNDAEHARNIWDLAMKRWHQREDAKPVEERDRFMLAQILAHLGQLEEKEGNIQKVIEYWEILKTVSPHPDDIQMQLDALKKKLEASKAKPPVN